MKTKSKIEPAHHFSVLKIKFVDKKKTAKFTDQFIYLTNLDFKKDKHLAIYLSKVAIRVNSNVSDWW